MIRTEGSITQLSKKELRRIFGTYTPMTHAQLALLRSIDTTLTERGIPGITSISTNAEADPSINRNYIGVKIQHRDGRYESGHHPHSRRARLFNATLRKVQSRVEEETTRRGGTELHQVIRDQIIREVIGQQLNDEK